MGNAVTNRSYTYTETYHPLTGDIIWVLGDEQHQLSRENVEMGVLGITDKFFKRTDRKYNSLVFIDAPTAKTVELSITTAVMPLVADIVCTKNACEVCCIRENSYHDRFEISGVFNAHGIQYGKYVIEKGNFVST